ncbi:MAG: ArsR family transcriptional regulator [Methanobacterium sp.]|nr:ArsR family transcriptional regulator [Methanobacterium sp.]
MNQVESKKVKRNTLNDGEIKIFGTDAGVYVIDSPIKTKILSLLLNKGLNGSDIVLMTGKSKSTISAHLKDLINAGIVDYKPDSVDGRRKIFFIKSRYLGELSKEMELEKDIDDYTYLYRQAVRSDDPFKFFKFILRTIRVSLMEEGVNIDPILHNAGIKIGETFYDELKSSQTDVLIKNITSFWQKHGLGRIELQKMEPTTIRIYDCFECEDLPKIGRPACVFDSGILEAVFSKHFNREISVEEIKCYTMDDEYCSFLIS